MSIEINLFLHKEQTIWLIARFIKYNSMGLDYVSRRPSKSGFTSFLARRAEHALMTGDASSIETEGPVYLGTEAREYYEEWFGEGHHERELGI